MINTLVDVMGQKTIDQYKIIEDRYLTLKRFIRLKKQKDCYISLEEIEMIIKALDNEPLEESEEKNNE